MTVIWHLKFEKKSYIFFPCIDKNYKSDCFFLCINRMENTSEHKLMSVAEDNIGGRTLSKLEATFSTNKIQYPLLAFHFHPYTLIAIHLIWWLINHSQLQFGYNIFGVNRAIISLPAKLSSRWTISLTIFGWKMHAALQIGIQVSSAILYTE